MCISIGVPVTAGHACSVQVCGRARFRVAGSRPDGLSGFRWTHVDWLRTSGLPWTALGIAGLFADCRTALLECPDHFTNLNCPLY